MYPFLSKLIFRSFISISAISMVEEIPNPPRRCGPISGSLAACCSKEVSENVWLLAFRSPKAVLYIVLSSISSPVISESL